ncbi:MAG TPA: hypothetical protein VMH28_30600 [Candidatus Acidoferrales bacterium]|nr:hypothetical protein [Candidatus Acidoferrales bacterium]
MKNTRRDIFKFAGGAAAGALLTPVPWRLIKDSSLWSENWPGIPRPARGEIRTKTTNCALCPAGCPVRARCVGDQPVSLAGAGCAFGVAAHHLPYHPARLRKGPVAEAKAALAKRSPADPIAILDLNPGRTASWTFRRAMGALKGTYIAPETNPVAYDLHAVRTVLSVGTPLLEAWGTPANVIAAREKFYLIHAGVVETRTAMLADQWIRAEGLPDPLPVALRENGPSVVIGDAPEIPELNRSLGAPVYARPEAPVPESWKKQAAPVTDLAVVPDRSVRFLLIDESSAATYVPWHRIEPKLAGDAVVITFAVARGGYARHATYALPAPVFPETTEDIPAAIDQTSEVFRLAAPLVAPPAEVVSAAEFASVLADVPAAGALRERADAIHKLSPGNFAAADDFWKALLEGYVWRGAPAGPFSHAGSPAPVPRAPRELALTAAGAAWTPALLSPLMTKLYEESNLRLPPNAVALNPRDAAGLPQRAVLQTLLGKCAVRVVADPAVPPGTVLTGSSPGIRDICSPGDGAKVVAA